MRGEPDDDADDAERREDPREGALRVDREDEQRADRDHRELREIADQDGHIRLRAVPREGAHGDPADPAGDQEGDRGDDERPEGARAVIEQVVAHDGRIEGHRPENRGLLDK